MVIAKETILSLYKKMLFIRSVEEAIANKYSEQEMRCPVHLSIGQEAVSTGLCEHLTKEDVVYSTHRCHAHYLAKGGSLKKMLAELYGRETGCCKGKGGSMHLIDLEAGFYGATPIVGNSLPVAVGAALATKMKKENKIVTVFLGDGTVEEGVFHESLNYASLSKLPVLFVCENNLFSVYTNLSERQPDREIYKLAEAHDVYSEKYDGYDVLNVFMASKMTVDFVKSGKGPAFLEFLTYRYREHCGPNYDDDKGYRSVEEYEKWKARDSIKTLEKYVLENKIADKNTLDQIQNLINKEIEEGFDFAKKSPFPKKEELYKGVYCE